MSQNKQNNNVLQLLFLKVEQADIRRTKEILNAHPNLVNQLSTKSGQTLLTVASRKGDLGMIKQLILSGANIDIQNKFHQSPLWVATFQQDIDCLDFLIAQGANLDLPDKKGWTPLMVAAHNGNKDIIKSLIMAGANIELISNKGQSILDVAKDNHTLNFINECFKQVQLAIQITSQQSFKTPAQNTTSQHSPKQQLGEFSKLETLTSFEVDPKLRRDLSTHFSPISTAGRFHDKYQAEKETVKEHAPPRNTAEFPQFPQQSSSFILRSKSVHNPVTKQQDQNNQEEESLPTLQLQIVNTALNQIQFLFNQQFELMRNFIIQNCQKSQDMDEIRRVIAKVPVSISQNTMLKDLEITCNTFKSNVQKSITNTLLSLLKFADTVPPLEHEIEPSSMGRRKMGKEMIPMQKDSTLFSVQEETNSQVQALNSINSKFTSHNSPKMLTLHPPTHRENPTTTEEEEKAVIVSRLKNLDQAISQRIARIHSHV